MGSVPGLMNLVGAAGRGEIVWLGFFLYAMLTPFADMARRHGDAAFSDRCLSEAAELRLRLEETGWDGSWYRRASFDDGSPLGSSSNVECQIDSIAQSWSVLSRAADPTRVGGVEVDQPARSRRVTRSDRDLQGGELRGGGRLVDDYFTNSDGLEPVETSELLKRARRRWSSTRGSRTAPSIRFLALKHGGWSSLMAPRGTSISWCTFRRSVHPSRSVTRHASTRPAGCVLIGTPS